MINNLVHFFGSDLPLDPIIPKWLITKYVLRVWKKRGRENNSVSIINKMSIQQLSQALLRTKIQFWCLKIDGYGRLEWRLIKINQLETHSNIWQSTIFCICFLSVDGECLWSINSTVWSNWSWLKYEKIQQFKSQNLIKYIGCSN